MSAEALFWSRPARVFDLDGTLVDTLPDLVDALCAALADLGLPKVGRELVRRSLHGGLEGSAAAALAALKAPASLREPLIERYRAHYGASPTARSRPYPGVETLLIRLCERGERFAVCTNKTQALARRVLTETGIAPYFAAIVGADTCAHRKPHPDPLLHALDALGAVRSQALLIGDSEVDAACARAAGVDCLLFAGGYGGPIHPPVARFPAYATLLQSQPRN